jgi:L-rhamnose mutarotase
VEEDFSFERKTEMDANDEFVLKWEALMSNYQKPFSWAK